MRKKILQVSAEGFVDKLISALLGNNEAGEAQEKANNREVHSYVEKFNKDISDTYLNPTWLNSRKEVGSNIPAAGIEEFLSVNGKVDIRNIEPTLDEGYKAWYTSNRSVMGPYIKRIRPLIDKIDQADSQESFDSALMTNVPKIIAIKNPIKDVKYPVMPGDIFYNWETKEEKYGMSGWLSAGVQKGHSIGSIQPLTKEEIKRAAQLALDLMAKSQEVEGKYLDSPECPFYDFYDGGWRTIGDSQQGTDFGNKVIDLVTQIQMAGYWHSTAYAVAAIAIERWCSRSIK